jgi:hypothetical protein
VDDESRIYPDGHYVDNWVSQVSQMLHKGVIYRHIILTVPAMFRTTFYQNAAVVLRAFMRCGAQCLHDFYTRLGRLWAKFRVPQKNLPLISKAYEKGSEKPFCELLSQIQGVTANLPSRDSQYR